LKIAISAILRWANINPDQFFSAVEQLASATLTVLKGIIAGPVSFATTLAQGVKDGVADFAANLGSNILGAGTQWLFGPPPGAATNGAIETGGALQDLATSLRLPDFTQPWPGQIAVFFLGLLGLNVTELQQRVGGLTGSGLARVQQVIDLLQRWDWDA